METKSTVSFVRVMAMCSCLCLAGANVGGCDKKPSFADGSSNATQRQFDQTEPAGGVNQITANAAALAASGTPAAALCNANDIQFYAQMNDAVQKYTFEHMPNIDPNEILRVARRYGDRLSASCLAIIDRLARQQNGARPETIPDWARRPWLPGECHAGTCAPPG